MRIKNKLSMIEKELRKSKETVCRFVGYDGYYPEEDDDIRNNRSVKNYG